MRRALLKRVARRICGAESDDPRIRLGRRYLKGSGLEVGALHRRFPVAHGATVTYVDRMDVDELRSQYPELADVELVPPDLIDDGEVLATFPDCSVDFVVASHFLEHCEDAIGTIEQHLQKLRGGGVLLFVVPDKREMFDRERELTTIAHLLRDHEEGPEWSRNAHFEEWVRRVDRIDEHVDEHVANLIRRRYSIHFHVWTSASFIEFVAYCRDRLGFALEIEALERAPGEFFVVLSKTA